MATTWSPIDPDDVVDLFIDFALPANKPFLPEGEDLTTAVVTAPDEVNVVTSDITAATKIVRVRVGPCEAGKHYLNYHLTTDTGQEFDADVPLTVKERIAK